MNKISEILIEQLLPSESNIITESVADASGNKTIWLNGVFMQADIKNRNGRVYPIHEIAKAVEETNKRILESNGVFGELDHPQSLSINLDRISHVITEMKMVGSDAVGKAKIIDTPMGNIARALIDSGVKIGVSSRGAGQMTEGNTVSDFHFITCDLVATPSAPGAVPDSIYESFDMSRNGREVLTLAESMKYDPSAQKYFKEGILAFLKEVQYTKR